MLSLNFVLPPFLFSSGLNDRNAQPVALYTSPESRYFSIDDHIHQQIKGAVSATSVVWDINVRVVQRESVSLGLPWLNFCDLNISNDSKCY